MDDSAARDDGIRQLSTEELRRRIAAYDNAILQLDEEMNTLNDGTHPELALTVSRLARARSDRELTAKKSFDSELLTLTRLHELELACFPASTNVSSIFACRERCSLQSSFCCRCAAVAATRHAVQAQASNQLERGVEMAREKILDQMVAKAKLAEARRDGTADDSTRMSTRSLRSKAGGGNDDGERSTGRRTTARRGAQSPASMLLEKTLSDADMEADFQSIADLQSGKKRGHEAISQ